MSTQHLPPDEARRVAVIRACYLTDTTPDAVLEDVSYLASRLCEAPIAYVAIIDAEVQVMRSVVGMKPLLLPREKSICTHAILSLEPTLIPDTTRDHRTKDLALVVGEPKIRSYAAVPLRTGNGHAVGTLCVVDFKPRELTPSQLDELIRLGRMATTRIELMIAAQELMAARSAVDGAIEAAGSFLANVGSKIREGATVMLGEVELLLENGVTPEERAMHAGTVRRDADRLVRLVADAMDISKLRAGQVIADRIACEPARVMREALAGATANAGDAGGNIEAEIDGTIPEIIRTDPARIRQAIQSVLEFALQTGTGVKLSARFEPASSGRPDRLCFEVTAQGSVVRRSHAEALAAPFLLEGATAREALPAAGLGLAIGAQLAPLLEGGFESRELPEGMAYTVTIPTGPTRGVRRISEWRARSESVEVPAAPEPGSLSGRVLVVEDSKATRELIGRMLSRGGLQPTLLPDAGDAVKRLTSDGTLDGPLAVPAPFDMVLMDLNLPGMNGFAATQLMRAKGFRGPIIAVTAHDDETDRDRCVVAGCDDCLYKPFDGPTLLGVCARWLERNRRRAA